jgi:5-methylcytosine-specific restriction enzyme A
MPNRIETYRPPGATLSAGARAAYEQSTARRADKAFYASASWIRLRRLKLAENPLCQPCQSNGQVVAAEQVHHILDRKDRPDLSLDYENLQSVCVPCHNAKRRG